MLNISIDSIALTSRSGKLKCELKASFFQSRRQRQSNFPQQTVAQTKDVHLSRRNTLLSIPNIQNGLPSEILTEQKVYLSQILFENIHILWKKHMVVLVKKHWLQSNIYIFLVKVDAVLTDQGQTKWWGGGEKTALPRNQVREKYYIFTSKATTFWARCSVNYVTRISHMRRHSKYTLFSIINSFYPSYVNCYGRKIFSNTEINQNLIEKPLWVRPINWTCFAIRP